MRARVLLFAYGTLLDPGVQRRVFGREVAVTPARLMGWAVKQNFVHGRYPGIVATKDGNTAGGLLRITANELAGADAYEDAPKLYRRVRVTVRAGAKRLRCWVYASTQG
ncbi:MAG TPA: gamma-glutamylcyclotransferase family protein [Candidatus Didemnitutus sp.]|nr:gamma-glutamylcyclotransferase family protein [Candidatus Didemnitutus sp.]